MAENPYHPEVRRLAAYLLECVGRATSPSKPSLNGYYQKFSAGKPWHVPYTTLRTTIRAKNRPDTETLIRMAQMLSASEGKEISYTALTALLEKPGTETDPELLEEFELVDGGPIVATRVGETIRKMRQGDRLRLTPDILRLLADDVEFLAAPPLGKAALLIRWECVKRGIGLERLIEETDVPTPIWEAFRRQEQPKKFTMKDAASMAGAVRCVDGDYGDRNFWLQFVTTLQRSKDKQ